VTFSQRILVAQHCLLYVMKSVQRVKSPVAQVPREALWRSVPKLCDCRAVAGWTEVYRRNNLPFYICRECVAFVARIQAGAGRVRPWSYWMVIHWLLW